MAEIVNLRRARKRKARDDKSTKAAENRATFGRSKSEKKLDSATKKLSSKLLDNHKRETE
jgi:hypothetical protein